MSWFCRPCTGAFHSRKDDECQLNRVKAERNKSAHTQFMWQRRRTLIKKFFLSFFLFYFRFRSVFYIDVARHRAQFNEINFVELFESFFFYYYKYSVHTLFPSIFRDWSDVDCCYSEFYNKIEENYNPNEVVHTGWLVFFSSSSSSVKLLDKLTHTGSACQNINVIITIPLR